MKGLALTVAEFWKWIARGCLTTVFACLAGPSAAAARDITGDLSNALDQERVAGIVWTIVDGTLMASGAAGYSNQATSQRMVPDNKVHVGSITKTLVAVGLLKLVSDGKLQLDTPVESLLPDIQFQNKWEASNPVRIRHLLDHTSGLEDARIWQVFSSKNRPNQPLGVVFERDPSVLRLRTRPGEVFSYSNMGYTLAAMIIEKVTGQRYEQWMQREILEPLDMADSSFFFVSQNGTHADRRLAWGHLGDRSLAAAMPTAVRPAAQFTTTSRDMAKFARFLMSDGRMDGQTIVRSELLDQMGHVSGTAAARAGLHSGYALGLVKRDREGRVGFCHQGDTVGYHALLCIYPGEQKAFFLALNSDGDGVDLQRFHRILLQYLAPKQTRPLDQVKRVPELNRWVGHYKPLVTRFAIERYADLLDGGVTLGTEGSHLVLERSGKPPLPLYPVDERRFRAADKVEASHVLFQHGAALILSDGQRTFRKVSDFFHYALWLNFGIGAASIVYILLSVPMLALKRQRGFLEPAFVCILAFIPAGLLLYKLPFSQWGDVSLASLSLFTATAALPVGMLVQMYRAAKTKYRFWKLDLIVVCCILQWLSVLLYFGLVPLRLWS